MTLPLMRKLLACIYYGDLLVALKAQTEPTRPTRGCRGLSREMA
jgi:hypothetical protein